MAGIGRKRKSEKVYKAYTRHVRSRAVCEFCHFEVGGRQYVAHNDHFWVVRNIFPYDFWDSRGVLDHLMIVPKRHIESLSSLSTEEKAAYVDLLGEYDLKGYSSYARAPFNTMKSVDHHHTHLMTYTDRPVRFMVYASRPHIHLSR